MRRFHLFLAIVGGGALIPLVLTLLHTFGSSNTNTEKDEQEVKLRSRSERYPVEVLTGFSEGKRTINKRPSEADIRIFHMEKYCNKMNRQSRENRVKLSQFAHIIYNDRYKTLYCQIPKVATTNWRRMFLILSGKMNTTDPTKLKSLDVHTKYDKYLNYLSDLNAEQVRYRLENYFKFVIVREPFERLLSAYRNKFGNLSTSSLYFHKRFGKHIIRKFRPNASREAINKGNDVTFSEFVHYILDPKRKEQLNEHWAEYNKLCLPCLINYDYIGKYETMSKDAEAIIDRMRASDVIEFPDRSTTYHHKKTENFLPTYFKQLSTRTVLQLWKFYYPDFLLFNYTLPKSLHNLTKLST